MKGATKLAFAVAAAVVALDAATKLLAVELLSGRGRVDVLGGLFHLELYRNFAGPGGRFAGHVVLISLFTLLAVAVLAVVATRVRTTAAALAEGVMGATRQDGCCNGAKRLLSHAAAQLRDSVSAVRRGGKTDLLPGRSP